jgi:hypothetical protein
MDEAWSFWEDAAHSAKKGDPGVSPSAVNEAVEAINEWLIYEYERSTERSASWLFIFAVAGVTAASSALFELNAVTLGAAFGLVGATFGYWYEKSRYRRLVRAVRSGVNAPTPFTEYWQGELKGYVMSLASTDRTIFGKDGHPTRFQHEITALDMVWLSGIKEADVLRRNVTS